MIDFDDVTKESINEHKSNWSEIPDHQCRIFLIRDTESKKREFII